MILKWYVHKGAYDVKHGKNLKILTSKEMFWKNTKYQ